MVTSTPSEKNLLQLYENMELKNIFLDGYVRTYLTTSSDGQNVDEVGLEYVMSVRVCYKIL